MSMNKAKLDELVALREAAISAAEQYKAALDATADRTGYNRKALGRYINALVRDKVQELRDELAGLEQLDLAFGPTPAREDAA